MSKLGVTLSLCFIFILTALIIIFFHPITKILYNNPVCGDGSLERTCSISKPYFCYNGILREKATTCGCPGNLTQVGDSCYSDFQMKPKEITLKYVLRGQENKFNYIVYGGLTDYLSKLPASISYNLTAQPLRVDFKLRDINEEQQKYLLLPLVAEIQNRASDKEDQARIAISIVQNIQWGLSDKKTVFRDTTLDYSRHPYEVLYDGQGICGEKSELLAFLLREIGYDVALFYNQEENHESVGIKCPIEKSWDGTGYCFVETTGPSIITDTSISYAGGLTIKTEPQVLKISDGLSLSDDMYEYKDAETLMDIRKTLNGKSFFFNPIKFISFNNLENKYGLAKEYNAG